MNWTFGSCYIVLCVIMCTPPYNCLPRHNAKKSLELQINQERAFFTLK